MIETGVDEQEDILYMKKRSHLWLIFEVQEDIAVVLWKLSAEITAAVGG